MHDHFKVPSLLTKKTSVSMILFWGSMGAALATAVSFAIFAGTGLVCYGRLYAIPYPLGRICLVLLVSLPCFGAGALLGGSSAWSSLLIRVATLIGFGAFLLWAASASGRASSKSGRVAAWASYTIGGA